MVLTFVGMMNLPKHYLKISNSILTPGNYLSKKLWPLFKRKGFNKHFFQGFSLPLIGRAISCLALLVVVHSRGFVPGFWGFFVYFLLHLVWLSTLDPLILLVLWFDLATLFIYKALSFKSSDLLIQSSVVFIRSNIFLSNLAFLVASFVVTLKFGIIFVVSHFSSFVKD